MDHERHPAATPSAEGDTIPSTSGLGGMAIEGADQPDQACGSPDLEDEVPVAEYTVRYVRGGGVLKVFRPAGLTVDQLATHRAWSATAKIQDPEVRQRELEELRALFVEELEMS